MANFDAQIQALAGTATQTEMDDWMNDGVREIVNILPPHLKETCYSKQTFTSTAANSESETMVTGQLGSVFAGSVECRQIRPMDKHKASSSTSIEYASATDPVYYVEGGKINILPASSSGVYYVISNPSVDASAGSAITNFPNEAEYLVVLYASIKVLQNKMNEMKDSIVHSDQDGSYTSVNTSGQNQGWEQVRYWLESEEDTEMAAVTTQALSSEMQQFVAEYQWLQAQQAKLQQDYDKGIQMLVAQGIPKQEQREAR